MEELLNKLYSYEYFGIYLIISIIVLVLLFIIILFFGNKDKKEREIEATKKLQQINNDAFKEDSFGEKLELESLSQETLENDTIIVPSIEDVPNLNATSENEIPEPVLPVQEEIASKVETPKVEEPVVNVPLVDETPVLKKEITQDLAPLLDKIEEKPLVFDDFNFEPEVPKIETIKEMPEVKEETSEMEVPAFNFDEIVKSVEETKKEQTYARGPQIFSSVYVPEKEEVEVPKVEATITATNDDLGFELPSLKKGPVVEEAKPEEVKEEKIDMPVLNDYDLDNLTGEFYTINK